MSGLTKQPSPPDPVDVPDPIAMPDAEDPALKVSSRKRQARRLAAGSRESTFMSKSKKLGGA